MSTAYSLVPFDINELKSMKTRRKPSCSVYRHVCEIVDEFVEHNYECCRICTCDDARKAHIENTILRRSVNSRWYKNVRVVLRGNSVYLVKRDRLQIN